MGFIDAYKELEKICNEIYDDNHGVSLYIDEMKNTPNGSRYVSGWDEDLKQLKHYRWVRNQIVHEPDCTEKNMCKAEDVKWIKNFYSRILASNDPLAKYRKSRKQMRNHKKGNDSRKTSGKSRKSTTYLDYILYFVIILLVIILFVYIQGM